MTDTHIKWKPAATARLCGTRSKADDGSGSDARVAYTQDKLGAVVTCVSCCAALRAIIAGGKGENQW